MYGDKRPLFREGGLQKQIAGSNTDFCHTEGLWTSDLNYLNPLSSSYNADNNTSNTDCLQDLEST